jgi:hypothetical protein
MKVEYIKYLAFVFTVVIIVLTYGCDEVLPPYAIPENVLVCSFENKNLDTVILNYFESNSTYSAGSSTFKINVVNTYDNLLQGDAEIGDRITIQSFGPSPSVMVVPITLGSLRSPPVFRGTIAMRPNDTAHFEIKWLPIDNKGKPAYIGLNYSQVDSAKVYGPVEFIAIADVRLFERVQAISSENYRFKLYFKEYTIKAN